MNRRNLVQFLKFNLVSFLVTATQLLLVNLLLVLMRNWKAPLPPVLASIFNANAVGAGNDNWGYVLPFFLSNLIANIIGFFLNRKTTFHSNAPKRNVFFFLLVLLVLIFISTWVQGKAVYYIQTALPMLADMAPTLAALLAGVLQFAVIFPLEKFVLLKEER